MKKRIKLKIVTSNSIKDKMEKECKIELKWNKQKLRGTKKRYKEQVIQTGSSI